MAVCEADAVRTLAILFGFVVLAGLVVMAVAGAPGALGILLTGVGLVAMIVMGTRFGGRHSAPRPSVTAAGTTAGAAAAGGAAAAPAPGSFAAAPVHEQTGGRGDDAIGSEDGTRAE